MAFWEPREWFKHRHMVTFSMIDPDWVMHRPSKRCAYECPHLMSECGEFAKRESEVPR